MIIVRWFGYVFAEESCFRAKVRAVEFPFARFPFEWNHSIEKESLKIKELEQVLGKKSGTFF